MDNRELCIRLVKAESEEDVVKILREAGYWDDESAWRDYGDFSVNFNTVGNQQRQAESALVEKLINSIDAMLLRECRRAGIDPEDRNGAPQTIKDATERFFGVNRGALSPLTSARIAELAENISLVATGDKDRPCVLVIDKGEGQTPNRFPETLVSLHRANKVRIPFVQGKFNMGGTGALQFCGRNCLQLIVSRRDPRIAELEPSDPTHRDWGFTVVRRFRPTSSMKVSSFRYLAPDRGILSFAAESLPVLPGKVSSDCIPAYEKPLEWGTLIKLYEYNLRNKSNILFGTFFHLSLLLPEAVLPITVFERRAGFKGRGWEKVLTGITVHLENTESMEAGFPSDSAISVAGHTLPCRVYVFSKERPDKGTSPYLRTERILYNVNGQTHGWEDASFFRRKSVKLSSYVADSVLIVVNCSGLPRDIAEDLFMNSRDRLRYDEHLQEIQQQLAKMIHENQQLKDLAVKRREKELSGKLGDEKPLEDLLRTALERSPSLARIFKQGPKLSRPFPMQHVAEQEEYRGKRFPTFFNLRSSDRRMVNSRRFLMTYDTDAANDYFTRDDEPGAFDLRLDGREAKFTWTLFNGVFHLGIDLPRTAEVGDILNYESKVTDCFRAGDPCSEDPFVAQFRVQVGKLHEHPTGGVSTWPARSDRAGPGTKGPVGITIPKVKEIKEADWGSEYNKFSALAVKDNGDEGYDFFVNMDNIYLLHDIKERSKLDPKILQAQYKYALVIMGLILLQDDDNQFEEKVVSKLDLIPVITRRLAPMLLPMIYDLASLVEQEK